MYSIFASDTCIYDDTSDDKSLKILNPVLTFSDCSAGSLEMTLPVTNVGHSIIKKMKTEIIVKKHNIEIWSGRVLNESSSFIKNRKLYCEGELAYLNDTTQPQAEYHDMTVQSFMETLISIHNAKVDTTKKFQIGVITVTDPNNSLYRYTNYEKTIECINKKLIEVYGGHLRVRKVNGVRYLDYLKDYPNTSSQVIEFGKNLLDFTTTNDMTEYATVILPLGAKLDSSPIETLDAYLTVKSVNAGNDYVESADAVAEYGHIEKVVKFDDVTEPNNLLTKANSYLSDIQFDNMVLEASAIDLHYCNVDVEDIKYLDLVRTKSTPHGMDRYFPVSTLKIPLANPENTTFTMGTNVKVSLTDVNNKVNSEILAIINSIPKKTELLNDAKLNATELLKMISNGYINILSGQNGSTELVITDDIDYTKAQSVWRWNINGLGHSSTGYNGEYGLALTMDGAIVADAITTGILNGSLIRAGIIRSEHGNSFWNLDTGELYIESVANLEATVTRDYVSNASAAIIEQNIKDYSDGKLADYTTSVTNDINSLQGQIDGSIMTWFYEVPPTNSVVPASEWNTTELKNNHLGDLYYDTITGYCYRYQVVNNIYDWQRLTDTDVTKALADASKAQDTADSKRRVFTTTPTTPYDAGDLWTQGSSGDFMRCNISRSIGSYIASDWSKASKYTDDTAIDNLQIGGRNQALKTGVAQTVTGTGLANQTKYIYDVNWANMLGKQATMSFDVISTASSGKYTIQPTTSPWWNAFIYNYNVSTTKQHYAATILLPSVIPSNGIIIRLDNVTGDVTISNLKIESGNKATDWTPAPEDVQMSIDEAKTAAENAQTSADDAISDIADISSDTKFTPSEKHMVRKEWDTIYGEYTANIAQADAFSITTEKTNYTNALVSLGTYLNAGTTYIISATIPTWISDTNINSTGVIVGTTFRANFVSFYNARQSLLNAISSKAKTLANTAQTTVDNLQIGGGNLLKQSTFLYTALPKSINFELASVNNISSAGCTANGFHYTATATNNAINSSYGIKVNSNALGIKVGDTITCSNDIKGTFGTSNNGLVIMHASTTNPAFYAMMSSGIIPHLTSIPDWTRKTRTYTIPSNIRIEDDGSFYIYIFWGGGTGSAVDAYVKNVKIEKGNKATDWTPAPEDIDSKFYDITIGKNVVLNSNFDNTIGWNGWSNYITNDNNGYSGKCIKTVGGLGLTRKLASDKLYSPTELIPGQEYTLSIYIKCDSVTYGTTNPFIRPYISYFLNNVSKFDADFGFGSILVGTTEWVKYVKTFVVYTGTWDKVRLSLYGRDFTGTVYWDCIKIEKGNKATDWTPAPEDAKLQLDASKFEFTNIVGCTVEGNIITKTATTSTWGNAGVSNTYKFNSGGSVEFKVLSGDTFMIGLSTVDTDQKFSTIDYALYIDISGAIHVREKGVKTYDSSNNVWTYNDVFAIKVNENKVSYYHNGICFYTSETSPVLPLVLDTAFYNINSSVSIKLGSDSNSDKLASNANDTATNALSKADNASKSVNDINNAMNVINNSLVALQTTMSTKFTQTDSDYTFAITKAITPVLEATNKALSATNLYGTYIKFTPDSVDASLIHILIGDNENKLVLDICNNKMSFRIQGIEVAYISNSKLYITDAEILSSLKIGKFAFIPRSSGNLSFKYVGL